MEFRNLFILNLKTFIIDFVFFIIGIFLFIGFTTLCRAEVGKPCSQPALSYVGLILMLFSAAHFLINLIIFIYKKIKT